MAEFIILAAGDKNADGEIIKLGTMKADMLETSIPGDYEETVEQKLLSAGEGTYYIELPVENYDESLMALEMILASGGFIQTKNFKRGNNIWKK